MKTQAAAEAAIGPRDAPGFWLDDAGHRAWLAGDARAQLGFFRASLDPGGGFHALDDDGTPLPGAARELHATTRLIHCHALGQIAGVPGCAEMVDHGMRWLDRAHRDPEHGGWFWSLAPDGTLRDGRKLAYGHVFVLLAGASARMAGHPDADRLIADAADLLDRRFREPGTGLYCDEFARDWAGPTGYRGMNANMHGVEALLAAYEATGQERFLEQAGQILAVFLRRIAPAGGWRIPEHYDRHWRIGPAPAGDPVFRPAGTTPGHSLEFARLALQHWDLCGRPEDGTPAIARALSERALADGWDEARGGLVYTIGEDGRPANRARYWWPVTEAIAVLAALIKLERNPDDEIWYRRMWAFAGSHLVDHARGGWFPEAGSPGRPAAGQFRGKPDLYHALQAALFPLAQGISRSAAHLPRLGGH